MEIKSPPDWPLLPGSWSGKTLMSNFDHEINQEVAQQLRDGEFMAKYSGWNFNADCWFADEQFYAAVYVYHTHRATFHAKTPQALMMLVSNAFGWD
jgi:hypothetical protein